MAMSACCNPPGSADDRWIVVYARRDDKWRFYLWNCGKKMYVFRCEIREEMRLLLILFSLSL